MKRLLAQLSTSDSRSTPVRLEGAWRDFLHEYEVKQLAHASNVSDTNLVSLLSHVIDVFKSDQRDDERHACFICVLENSFFMNMCTLAAANSPTGLRRLLLRGIDAILSSSTLPLLANTDVHGPITILIRSCIAEGLLNDANERDFIAALIRTICVQLRLDSSLCPVIFDDKPVHTNTNNDNDEVSVDVDTLVECQRRASSWNNSSSVFVLIFGVLIGLCLDKDSAGDLARDGVLCCLKIDNDAVHHFICQQSPLFANLSQHLTYTYEGIVSDNNDDDGEIDDETLQCFMNTLEFVADVASAAKNQAHSLCEAIDTYWLRVSVHKHLLHSHERIVHHTTFLLRQVMLSKQLVGSPLQRVMIEFLVGNIDIRTLLIHRIDDVNDKIAVETIALFEALLALRDETVYTLLLSISPCTKNTQVLHSSCVRHAFDGLLSMLTSNDNHEFETYLIDAVSQSELWLTSYSRWSTTKTLSDSMHDIHHTHDVVDDKDGVKSCVKDTSDSSNDAVADASADDDVDVFSSSLFLQTICEKITGFLGQSFEMNLRLTSILAHLALCPHPAIYRLILNIDEIENPHASSCIPLLALAQVWKEAKAVINTMPNIENRLRETRREIDSNNQLNIEIRDNQLFLRALIVMAECIQELSAISKVKARMLQLSGLT